MKIEYLRNMQFGYMRIAATEPLSKMEKEMLSHNVIEGILPIRWQQENDLYLLRYDITGKLSLDAVLESAMLDESMLRNLLSGICSVVKQLEKHLLKQEGLLLQPETIFVDSKSGNIFFCYCPNGQGTIQGRFRQLMEYILAKTDHKNLEVVELAYGVYEETLNEAFVLQDIQSRLEKKQEAQCMEEEIICAEEIDLKTEIVEENGENFSWRKGVEKMVAWINKQMQKFIKRKQEIEPIVFEPEEEEEQQNLPTILLGEWEGKIEGILKYEGKYLLPDIHMDKMPFMIGSGSNCDGVINRPTISRQHAKVYNIDGIYFIEDLNSTNGTTVDGGILSYKTKVSLKKNAKICFANEPYHLV